MQVFDLTVQAALGIFSLSAIALITLAVNEKISQVNVVYHCGKDEQRAPPFGNPQAFREKGLT